MSKVVCIVDDQTSLRQMVRFALNVQGLDVLEAENGVDALEKLQKNHVDILIVDWQMPVMDGLELVSHLRKIEQYLELPVIFVSCGDDLMAKKTAMSLGALAWLKKPFRLSEIQSVVECGLGLATSNKSAVL